METFSQFIPAAEGLWIRSRKQRLGFFFCCFILLSGIFLLLRSESCFHCGWMQMLVFISSCWFSSDSSAASSKLWLFTMTSVPNTDDKIRTFIYMAITQKSSETAENLEQLLPGPAGRPLVLENIWSEPFSLILIKTSWSRQAAASASVGPEHETAETIRL